MNYRSSWMTAELDIFRETFRRYLSSTLSPQAHKWRNDKMIDREAWLALGEIGALCPDMPEEYGGLGGTFAHVAAVIEDLEFELPEMALPVAVHNAIVAQYIMHFGSHAQKQRWLPGLATGQSIGAIAMTEPGGGSDLRSLRTRASRKGSAYLLNGSKTFITNGQVADIIIVAAQTAPDQGAKGISLLVLEADGSDGFRRGRNLDKIGMHASDTSELFFDDALVPAENLLGGEEGRGLYQMMELLPKERLAIAVSAVASIERMVEVTTDYVKDRKAFGKPVLEFQNTAFALAERKSEALIGRVFLDWCIERAIKGELDQVTASIAKYWTTDKQFETADKCLQLHGGYGYMDEFEIARRFVDARVQRIYGGTNEIMKVLIARSL
ncbi:acyl-CoA dehydrogenase family protein [Microvirga guangxiensis]|uniref:Acyl-CoA dehydrogenase n=1 Tax=Microvirga guangxiensis TaxID=549386 RepID=A0A1G5I4X5_9HYPH|nr:acyl-CoA dehydrogenase family protein [Microvirga guangxiensis]SCY71063.1 acyl-CoA dehydrogenase [Microvirga guangxiensis]